jgi:hypothetical protein
VVATTERYMCRRSDWVGLIRAALRDLKRASSGLVEIKVKSLFLRIGGLI